jgi:hypothetical protein
MNKVLSDMHLIESHASAMDRIFRLSDLAILFHAEGKSLHDRIGRMVDNQLLSPICRGLYGMEGWTLPSVSGRLYPDSFVSGPSMLAEYLMIGTMPTHQLFCIKTGLPRTFEIPQGRIVFHSVKPEQHFGYTRQGFVNKADPERALVDTLYYYLRGEQYFFDLFSDVNIADLEGKRFTAYVNRFNNPKFKAFAHEYYRTHR